MLTLLILSSIFLGALNQADSVSKVSRTKSMVQKFSNMLMARWDNYRNMRLPISADAVMLSQGADQDGFRKRAALRRLLALRELQRMEYPDRYEDLMFQPVVLTQPDYQQTGASTTKPIRPALWSAYLRKIRSAANGKGCDADGSVCTVGDVCAGGGCQPGKAVGCDDGNPCTDDACEKAACTHLASSAGKACDDGQGCTSADSCQNGKCGGVAVQCEDGNPCTKDACDTKTGACASTPTRA